MVGLIGGHFLVGASRTLDESYYCNKIHVYLELVLPTVMLAAAASVRLHGLSEKNGELNGQLGSVHSFDSRLGRWKVRVGLKLLAIHESNLLLTTENSQAIGKEHPTEPPALSTHARATVEQKSRSFRIPKTAEPPRGKAPATPTGSTQPARGVPKPIVIDRTTIPTASLESEFTGSALTSLAALGVQAYDATEFGQTIMDQVNAQLELTSNHGTAHCDTLASVASASAGLPQEPTTSHVQSSVACSAGGDVPNRGAAGSGARGDVADSDAALARLLASQRSERLSVAKSRAVGAARGNEESSGDSESEYQEETSSDNDNDDDDDDDDGAEDEGDEEEETVQTKRRESRLGALKRKGSTASTVPYMQRKKRQGVPATTDQPFYCSSDEDAADEELSEGLRIPGRLWKHLFPHQRACVEWLWGLHRSQVGGVLGDDMCASPKCQPRPKEVYNSTSARAAHAMWPTRAQWPARCWRSLMCVWQGAWQDRADHRAVCSVTR